MRAGRTMPPSDAITGNAPDRKLARCPTVNSRLISSPTTKKKIVKSPWFTQSSNVRPNVDAPHWNPRVVFHQDWNAVPRGELLSTSASNVARPRSKPDDGPQRQNSNTHA